jgi:hypothetical protein
MKCRKIVKFVSITHSELNFWSGPIVSTAISREKRKPVLEGNGCLTSRSLCVLKFARYNSFVEVQRARCNSSTRVPTAIWTSWSSWDVDPKVVWTVSLQSMHMSSKWSRGEAKCYRRDGRQSALNFHSQPQEICAKSQSRVEDTGAHSEENSTETTAVVTVQTATGTKYSGNIYTPCIITL